VTAAGSRTKLSQMIIDPSLRGTSYDAAATATLLPPSSTGSASGATSGSSSGSSGNIRCFEQRRQHGGARVATGSTGSSMPATGVSTGGNTGASSNSGSKVDLDQQERQGRLMC